MKGAEKEERKEEEGGGQICSMTVQSSLAPLG